MVNGSSEGEAGFKGGIGTAVYLGITGSREGFTGKIAKGEDIKGISREEV
jgi:hypothetical protein